MVGPIILAVEWDVVFFHSENDFHMSVITGPIPTLGRHDWSIGFMEDKRKRSEDNYYFDTDPGRTNFSQLKSLDIFWLA